jgi:hypothetical protein
VLVQGTVLRLPYSTRLSTTPSGCIRAWAIDPHRVRDPPKSLVNSLTGSSAQGHNGPICVVSNQVRQSQYECVVTIEWVQARRRALTHLAQHNDMPPEGRRALRRVSTVRGVGFVILCGAVIGDLLGPFPDPLKLFVYPVLMLSYVFWVRWYTPSSMKRRVSTQFKGNTRSRRSKHALLTDVGDDK